MHTTVLNHHPPSGSKKRRHAGATSSPPVAPRIKAGDFSSAAARMLLAPSIASGCFGETCFGLRCDNSTGIWPEGGGLRTCAEGAKCMQTVGILLGVFARTSSVRVSLGCVCLFLFVHIQGMFVRGSQTTRKGSVHGGHPRSLPVSERV